MDFNPQDISERFDMLLNIIEGMRDQTVWDFDTFFQELNQLTQFIGSVANLLEQHGKFEKYEDFVPLLKILTFNAGISYMTGLAFNLSHQGEASIAQEAVLSAIVLAREVDTLLKAELEKL